MRSTLLPSQRASPPRTSKRTTFTHPVPTSMPAVMGMALPSGGERALREGRRPERAGVDGLGVDVDGDVAVVLLHERAELPHRRLVLGDAAGEGELIADPAGARDD